MLIRALMVDNKCSMPHKKLFLEDDHLNLGMLVAKTEILYICNSNTKATILRIKLSTFQKYYNSKQALK